VALVTTFSLLLQNFGVNGFVEAIIQQEKLDHTIVNTLFWINATISFALTLLFIACAPLLSRFYSEPRVTWITGAIALSIIASGISAIHQGLLSRSMQFTAISIIGVISKLTSLAIAICLALIGLKYWSLVANIILVPLTGTIGAWVFCKWRPGSPTLRTDVKKMIRFAFHTYGKFALNYGSRNFDNLLVGKYLGISSLGYYKKAYDLFALPASGLTAPLSNIALSALSRYSGDHEIFRQYYLGAISRIAFVSMGLSLFLTISAKDIIILLLGPQWTRSAAIFMFFGPGIGLMLIYYTHGWLHLSLGRPDRWFRWGIIELVSTALLLAGGVFFGPTGVAFAWTASFYILTLPGLLYAGHPAALRASSIMSAIWKYLVSSFVAGFVGWQLLLSDHSLSFVGRMPIVARILASFLICGISYSLTLFLLFRNLEPFRQFCSLVREMIPTRSVRQTK